MWHPAPVLRPLRGLGATQIPCLPQAYAWGYHLMPAMRAEIIGPPARRTTPP